LGAADWLVLTVPYVPVHDAELAVTFLLVLLFDRGPAQFNKNMHAWQLQFDKVRPRQLCEFLHGFFSGYLRFRVATKGTVFRMEMDVALIS
jgi:hypothetical protein